MRLGEVGVCEIVAQYLQWKAISSQKIALWGLVVTAVLAAQRNARGTCSRGLERVEVLSLHKFLYV